MILDKVQVKQEESNSYEKEYEEIDLEKFLLQISSDIEEENPTEEIRRRRKWSKNRAFYRGQQRGFWSPSEKQWVARDLDTLSPEESSILTVNNQYRPQVKTLQKEFSRSQVRVRSGALSDSQTSVLASRFVDSLVRFYQSRLMPESTRQLESKYLLLCGNSFRYTYYSKEVQGAMIRVPEIGEMELPAYKGNVCAECGHKQESPEECEKCSGIVKSHEIPAKKVKAVKGYKSENSGDAKTDVVDPAEIKVWAGAKTLDESPYLRRKRIVTEQFLCLNHPNYKPDKEGSLSKNALQQLKFFGVSNEKDETTRKLYEYDQIWLEPSYFKNKKLKKPIKLYDGKDIPAGSIINEVFPDGVYHAKVNNTIIEYANENKKDYWLHIPYDVNVDGIWADGLDDAIQNQQIINEYGSLSIENVLYNASPKLIINPKLINPATVTGSPRHAILMNDNASKETQPRQAFGQLQGMSLSHEVMQGIEFAKRDMREQTGALVGFNGNIDANVRTATEISIARDSALALVSTPLALRAEKDIDWMWQILNHVKKNWYEGKYKFLLGKYNEQEAQAFKRSNIKHEINLNVEANSWMPQTNYEKLQNLQAYLTAFGLPLGFLNPQIPQVVRDYASQIYQIPFDFNELAPDYRIANKRLNRAKESFNTLKPSMELAQTPEELELLSLANIKVISDTMEIEEDIDEHPVFVDVYVKWLKTDEGQNADPILREAVKAKVNEHREFMKMAEDEMMQRQAMMLQAQNAGGQPPKDDTFRQVDPAENPFNPPDMQKVQDFTR